MKLESMTRRSFFSLMITPILARWLLPVIGIGRAGKIAAPSELPVSEVPTFMGVPMIADESLPANLLVFVNAGVYSKEGLYQAGGRYNVYKTTGPGEG